MFFLFIWAVNFAFAVDMLIQSFHANEKRRVLVPLSLLWVCLTAALLVFYYA